MIALSSKNISSTTQQHLHQKQQQVDSQPDFPSQKDKAKSLWKGKKGSNAGRAAFDEIKTSLLEMGVGTELCNYCENNEGTDIEHIRPKDWYPDQTFVWDNYLLACRTCNTDHKNNKFAVFDAAGNILDLLGQPLPNAEIAFIDPRREDPSSILMLNLERGVFVIHPELSDAKQRKKGVYTLDLLSLNDRNTLIEARKSAFKYYYDRFERYVKLKKANSFDDLDAASDPINAASRSATLTHEAQRLMQLVKEEIQSYAHPSVWKEMVRQRKQFKKLQNLFVEAPEALNW